MVLHPEAQKKAQEELDRVIGHGRLPEFNDRDSLPYVSALMYEVMRVFPIAPFGTLCGPQGRRMIDLSSTPP